MANRIHILLLGFLICFGIIEVKEGFSSERVFQNWLGMEFIRIPGGSFIMGSPVSEPYRSESEAAHPVMIQTPFYLQVTEVTLGQWRAVMGREWFDPRKGENQMPVTHVSWHDCYRFIKKLNAKKEGFYRLPTEAEWEYAGRAGSRSAYAWGEVIECGKAMYGNNRLKTDDCIPYNKARGLLPDMPAPVKSYPPNAWGLYDMHGNVWEWCHDWYGPYPKDQTVDPKGSRSGPGRVRRGGSWFGEGELCRSANRAFSHPATRLNTSGFRLVWSPDIDKNDFSVDSEKIRKEQDGP